MSMIDKMSSQLNIDILTNGDDNKNLVRNNGSGEASSGQNFNDLIATLNATLADSITALSINNANKSSKTDFVPSFTGNVGNYATSVSSDGKLSSPSIKQAPVPQPDNDLIIHIGNSKNETIQLGKNTSSDL